MGFKPIPTLISLFLTLIIWLPFLYQLVLIQMLGIYWQCLLV